MDLRVERFANHESRRGLVARLKMRFLTPSKRPLERLYVKVSPQCCSIAQPPLGLDATLIYCLSRASNGRCRELEPSVDRFVVVHNGRHEDYQVAVALHEVGALAALVTDYYSKTGMVRRRYSPLLAGAVIVNDPHSIAVQAGARTLALLRPGVKMPWPRVEKSLGDAGRHLAVKLNAGLLVYSGGTAANAFEGFDGAKSLKVVHPVASQIQSVLAEDAEKWAVSDAAVLRERDMNDPHLAQNARREVLLANRAILVASEFTAKGVRPLQSPEHGDHVVVVPYGCPPPIAMSDGPRGDKVRFLFIGQCVQRKGIHHLLATWRAAGLGRAGARLTLVMPTYDTELLGPLEDESVTVHSRLSRERLEALMDDHHVLILPSLVEGFGLVIAEALSRGLYVIASTNTGWPDIPNKQSGSGDVVLPGDREDLRRALETALESDVRSRAASLETARGWQWGSFRSAVRRAYRVAQTEPE